MDESTDEDLLDAIAAGPGALPEFYRRHVGRIIAFGARRLDRPEDVADFAAAVFLQVIESAGTFDRRRGSGVAWLYGLASHVAARERRRRAMAANAAMRLAGHRLLDPDDYARLEEQIDAGARARAVHLAMEQLTGTDRRLLQLVAVDGLAPAEAADALGISRVAARVRLLRARRRLRELLPENAGTTSSRPTENSEEVRT